MLLLKSTTQSLQLTSTSASGVTALDVSASYRDTQPGSTGAPMPSMVGYAYTSAGQSGTTLTVTPDGTLGVGMWMLMVMESFSTSAAFTDPVGWTILQPQTIYAGTLETAIYAKQYVAGETSYTITMPSDAAGSNLTLMWFSGADDVGNWIIGSNMLRANITPTTSTNNVAPSITTTVANTLALAVSTERTSATETGIVSMTGATPWFFGAQPNSIQLETISVGYISQTTPGATGDVTVVYPNTQSTNGMAIQIGIPPVAGSSGSTTTVLSSSETKIQATASISALPTMVGYSYTNVGATATAIAVSPDGTIAAGMWMIMVMSTYTPNVTITDPAGWTIIQPQSTTAGTLLTVIYAKQYVAGETTYTITTNTGANGSNLTLMWFSGADVVGNWVIGNNMLRANITPTTSANNVAPSITTIASHSLVLAISTERTTASETGITSMTGATPWFFGAQVGTTQLETISVGYINQVANGATGDVTIAYPNTQSTNGMAIQIGISPVSGGSGSSTAATTIIPAPASAVARVVKILSITNTHTTAVNTIVVQKNISGTIYNVSSSYTLQPGEMVMFMDGVGWVYYAANGAKKADQILLASTDSRIQINNNGSLTGTNTWAKVNLPQTGWSSSAFSQDGTKMIAGVNNGSMPAFVSADAGQTWGSTTGLLMTTVEISNDGTKLAGISASGGVYTSTNAGAVWVKQSFPVTTAQQTMGISADGTKLIAAGAAGSVYLSVDSGVTWAATSLATGTWTVASSSDGTKLAAASGSGTISTSKDSGATWTSQAGSGSHAWVDMVMSPSGTVMAGVASTNAVYLSIDSGVTWSTITGPGQTLTNVGISTDGKTILVGATTAGSFLYLSTDGGTTWTKQTNLGAQAFTSISLSADGNKMIATMAAGLYTNLNSAPSWAPATATLSLPTGGTIRFATSPAAPALPATGNMTLYAAVVAGRSVVSKRTSSGDIEAMQSALWQNPFILWTPGPGGSGTWIGSNGSTTGSVASPLPTQTNVYTSMRRSTFSTVVTTTNQQVGITTEQVFRRGSTTGQGGFFYVCRFGFDAIATGMRAFIGLVSNGNIVNVDPSTVSNICGFGFDLADTAISFIHNGPTVTTSKEPISGQGTLATNNTGYDAYIWCAPNSSEMHYRLDRVDTGAVLVEGVVTTNLPLNTQLLQGIAYMSNGTANTAVNAAVLGVNRIYAEYSR